MKKSTKATSVFISYNRADVDRARELQSELEAQGFNVWRDQTNVYGGERWPKTLGEAVADSNVLILLWSDSSSTSDFVELEWCTAMALKKPILPIMLDTTQLPASLAAVHALPNDVTGPTLAGSLHRIARSADSRINKNRRTAIFQELNSDGDDVASLASRVHSKADEMSSPRYLALELLRSLVIPAVLSLVSAFAATAVIWDNPFRLDANLVLFGAIVAVPTVILVTMAFVVRRRSVKALLLASCVGVLALLTWYQPRIVAGPVASVDEVSVVILFHNEAGSDPYAARMINELNSLR